MNKLKAKWHYLARFLGWLALLEIIFEVIYGITFIPIKGFLTMCGEYSPGFEMFAAVTKLAVYMLILHVILEKIFFKPYKHITITPKFSKVTFWFTLKIYFIILGILLIVISVVYLTIMMKYYGKPVSLDKYAIYTVYSELKNKSILITLLFTLFIIHRIVKKNATIEAKTQI